MIGIRLDSGDLAYLSIEARKMLDEAGFPDAAIVACNDLDEHIITSLKEQGADDRRLGRRHPAGHRLRPAGPGRRLQALGHPPAAASPGRTRSSSPSRRVKISTPGILQVRRYFDAGTSAVGDMIFDETAPLAGAGDVIVDPADDTRRKTMPPMHAREDLLVPSSAAGRRVYDLPQPRPSIAGAARRNWPCSTPASSASSIRTSTRSAWSGACTTARTPTRSSRAARAARP